MPALRNRLIDDEGHWFVGSVLQEVLALYDGDVGLLRDSINHPLLPMIGVQMAFDVTDNVVVTVARWRSWVSSGGTPWGQNAAVVVDVNFGEFGRRRRCVRGRWIRIWLLREKGGDCK